MVPYKNAFKYSFQVSPDKYLKDIYPNTSVSYRFHFFRMLTCLTPVQVLQTRPVTGRTFFTPSDQLCWQFLLFHPLFQQELLLFFRFYDSLQLYLLSLSQVSRMLLKLSRHPPPEQALSQRQECRSGPRPFRCENNVNSFRIRLLPEFHEMHSPLLSLSVYFSSSVSYYFLLGFLETQESCLRYLER